LNTECAKSLLEELLIDHVRIDMRVPGFHILDTLRLAESIPLITRTIELPMGCRQWRKFPQLARYALWVESLLQQALPEELICLDRLEYRIEAANSQEPDVDQWHVDGSYVRSACTVQGMSTIVLHQEIERAIPLKQTLLMTAMGRGRSLRIPCTLHRRPGAGPARAVIVCSFESRVRG
jgi:hypothetical protein